MNILKLIAITLIIIISISVAFFKPKMHRKIRIENAEFNVVQFSEKKAEEKAPPFYAPKNKPEAETQPEQPKEEYIKNPTVNTTLPQEAPKASQASVPKPKKTPQTQQPSQPIEKQPQKNERELTAEQQEIIAWNKWRSDLQNKVMRESKIMAPVGTRFGFSFTVDKFGNISNLRVSAEPSCYTQMALKHIRPVLLSYQEQEILKFPPESKRVVVNIEGHFSMARTSKFSSPSDYSDYERVK